MPVFLSPATRKLIREIAEELNQAHHPKVSVARRLEELAAAGFTDGLRKALEDIRRDLGEEDHRPRPPKNRS